MINLEDYLDESFEPGDVLINVEDSWGTIIYLCLSEDSLESIYDDEFPTWDYLQSGNDWLAVIYCDIVEIDLIDDIFRHNFNLIKL